MDIQHKIVIFSIAITSFLTGIIANKIAVLYHEEEKINKIVDTRVENEVNKFLIEQYKKKLEEFSINSAIV
mgnify:CR=1 FL=1